MTTTATQSPARSSAKVGNANADFKQWIIALQQPVPRVRTPILYRLMQLLVVVVMLILPVIYVGLIGLLGYVIYLHAVNDTGMVTAVRGGRAMVFMLMVYLAPIVGGVVSIFFMFKPFFAPKLQEHIPVTITPEHQPKLFVLVENLCHAIKAPVPTQIVVDTQVNASASFRKGFLSFLGNDLTLTIGLPLASCLSAQHFVGILAHEFGHFSQGAGMRLSFLINSISHWFARVVYERDKWDHTLVDMAQQSESALFAIFIAIVRLMVFISRCVLWILMIIGNIASCLLLRQMEYDADRHEASIAGSDGFEQTVHELHRINIGQMLAAEHLRQFTGQNQAPDNVPALIAYHAQQVTDEQKAKITEHVNTTRTGLFSTHPSDKSRIKSAQRADMPGVFPFNQPASALFTDFDKLCRGATAHMLHHQCGESYQRLQLVEVEQLQQQHKQVQDAQSNSERFLGPCVTPLLPIHFPGHISDKLPSSRQALADLKNMAKQAHLMLANPDLKAWNEQMADAYSMLIDLKQFCIRGEYGIKDSLKSVGLTSDSLQSINARKQKLNQLIHDAKAHLKPLNELQTKRIFTALQLLHSSAADKIKDVDELRNRSKALFLAYRAVSGVIEKMLDLNSLRHACIALLQSLDKKKQDEMYINKILNQSREIADHLRSMRTLLIDQDDPYVTGHSNGRLSYAIIPQLTDPKDVGATIELAGTAVEKTLTYAQRLISDLVEHAQKIEKAAGIEQPPAQD